MSRLLVNNRWMHGIRLVGALYCRLCQRLQGRLRNCLVSRRHSCTIRQADRRSGQSDLFGFDAGGRTLLGLGQVGCRRLLAGGRGRGGDGYAPGMGGGRVTGPIAAVDGYPAWSGYRSMGAGQSDLWSWGHTWPHFNVRLLPLDEDGLL